MPRAQPNIPASACPMRSAGLRNSMSMDEVYRFFSGGGRILDNEHRFVTAVAEYRKARSAAFNTGMDQSMRPTPENDAAWGRALNWEATAWNAANRAFYVVMGWTYPEVVTPEPHPNPGPVAAE